ncbi:MAG TPA: tetratricopeptide repeat protein [Candidatus Bilamarchaeaceae archaeon]|nr:tetratricopeptide repeat protein [Candidatus Bilamarchaeaceae archaeon]
MATVEEAKSLLAKRDYPAAGRLLDQLLARDKSNDALWYLRALVFLQLKHYRPAEEALEHALAIRPQPAYWRTKGLMHMEACEFSEAVESFQHVLKANAKDADAHVLIALCYMFLNDFRSRGHMQRAHRLDKKKTKRMLMQFYDTFFKLDPRLSERRRRLLAKKLESIA